jgi:hypothetical protein
MFKRMFIEDWALSIPIISFCIFFVVFAAVTIRALRISKSERERLAALPLEPSEQPPESKI